MSTETIPANTGGHTLDGEPWPEPNEKPRRKKDTEPAPVANEEA